MKIKASQVKPGMVIGIDRGDNYGDVCLVLAIKNTGGIFNRNNVLEYTHLDVNDCYFGPLVGSIRAKSTVKVITGSERKATLKKIKDQVFKSLHNVERTIDTIRLIEAMGGNEKN